MKASHLLAIFALCMSVRAMAFQTYTGEDGHPQIDPSIKNFTFYISPTYWSLSKGLELPINEFIVESTKDAMEVIERDLGHLGVTLTYGGLFDTDRLRDKTGGSEFYGKIYLDYSSRTFVSMPGAFAGVARQMRMNAGDSYNIGGIVYFNGKNLNYNHPLGENYRTPIHEALHVLGIGHSTNSSSLMAYTENWQPRLSRDDISAAESVYGVESGSSATVSVTKAGSAAMGVEVVWIRKDDGRSQITVTDSAGVAVVKGLAAGDYYIGVRELTPTGPCFATPTQGFLTSFYVSDTESTNSLGEATVVSLDTASTVSYSVPVIVGTKKYDCHYVGAFWCRDESMCGRARFAPGASGRANFQNDLSATHHQTDTDTSSGVHADIQVSTIGTTSPFTIGTSMLGDDSQADVGYNLLNYTSNNLSIAENATEGNYAMLCEAGGETSLVSSALEVMTGAGYFDNSEVWPQYIAQMDDASAPRNYQELKAQDKPSSPKRTFGMACGSIGAQHVGKSGMGPPVLFLLFVVPAIIMVSQAVVSRRRKDY